MGSTLAGSIRVIHVISGLGAGGAENMLLKLVSALNGPDFENIVVSLGEEGPLAPQFRDQHVPVHALGMSPRRPSLLAAARLSRLFVDRAPSVVHTWMYHADLMGGILAGLSGAGPLIWSVRCSAPTETHLPKYRSIMRSCARISSWLPKVILFNSWQGLEGHERAGYSSRKLAYIPNGFDLRRFGPSESARAEIRKELGLDPEAELVGMVARYMPEAKDHETFLRAAAIIARERPKAAFVLCGDRIDSANTTLAALCRDFGLEGRVRLLGSRSDIPRVTAALDVATLVSLTESFPNVVGEAMASGVPCVVTDVGDCRDIVRDERLVVPPRDPAALARAWSRLLAAGRPIREAEGAGARKRVAALFSLESVAARYAALYRDLSDRKAPPLEQARRSHAALYD